MNAGTEITFRTNLTARQWIEDFGANRYQFLLAHQFDDAANHVAGKTLRKLFDRCFIFCQKKLFQIAYGFNSMGSG